MAFVPVPLSLSVDAPAPLRVLVVEDEPTARAALKNALADAGYDCQAADNACQALDAHTERCFDLVISDFLMPGNDGMQLCQSIREHDESTRYTYFILMTAFCDKVQQIHALRDGADEFIAKPIDLDELEARLVAAERIIRVHRQLAATNVSLRRDSKRFELAAHLDPLTHAFNRLQLDEDLPRVAAQAMNSSTVACLALCDIDHFKQYNDGFGHLAGDEVLCRVADAIRRSIRDSDALYRYGGEEFVILMPKLSPRGALQAMDRVRLAVQSLGIDNPEGAWGQITLSVGVAPLHGSDALDPKDWLLRADQALYRAKAGGRNRCEWALDGTYAAYSGNLLALPP